MLMSQEQQRLEEVEAALFARIAGMLEEHRSPCSARPPSRDRPRIGVFGGKGTLRDGAWQVYGGDLYTVDAIAEAGGYPQELPTFPIVPGVEPFDLLTNYETFRAVFDTVWPVVRDLDGLVLTGGGDLDARFLYHTIPHPRLQPADLWRDTWEWFATLIGYALFKTTFGICRGLQVMNVVLRGGLFQDHEELRKRWRKGMPPLLAHRQGRPIFKNFIGHPLVIVQGSWLAQVVRARAEHAGQRDYLDDVLTQHHNFIGVLATGSEEIIGDLADGLVVAGYAPDRVIEAIASADPRRVYIAVQFHPEYVRTLSWARGIFSYVVEAATRDAEISRALYESFREDILAWLWLNARTLHALQSPEGANEKAVEARTTDALQDKRVAVPLHAG
jgi:gamma-glutamyl-gamma-aminobutyrate hydrolase PuuD